MTLLGLLGLLGGEKYISILSDGCSNNKSKNGTVDGRLKL